ncbi:MAG: hypothetical protein ACOVQC_02155 [Flavobacterium sp.]
MILSVTTIYLSILIFVACAKSNNTNESNENKIETFEIPQIEKSQDQQVETNEMLQVDIPKKMFFNISRYGQTELKMKQKK